MLLGPSGSGKTTLLRSVAGLEKPDSGEIVFERQDRVSPAARGYSRTPEERQIGMVFQSYAIWPHLTVAENIGLVLTHGRSRMSKQSAMERICHSLELVQLENFEDRPARLLSGGQQQRVALARALAVNPALLIDGRAVEQSGCAAEGRSAGEYQETRQAARQHSALCHP